MRTLSHVLKIILVLSWYLFAISVFALVVILQAETIVFWKCSIVLMVSQLYNKTIILANQKAHLLF